jgi:hypothetical protein
MNALPSFHFTIADLGPGTGHVAIQELNKRRSILISNQRQKRKIGKKSAGAKFNRPHAISSSAFSLFSDPLLRP